MYILLEVGWEVPGFNYYVSTFLPRVIIASLHPLYISNIIKIIITHLFLGVCGSHSPMRLSMLGSRSLVQPNVATILSLQLAQHNVALQSASSRIFCNTCTWRARRK